MLIGMQGSIKGISPRAYRPPALGSISRGRPSPLMCMNVHIRGEDLPLDRIKGVSTARPWFYPEGGPLH